VKYVLSRTELLNGIDGKLIETCEFRTGHQSWSVKCVFLKFTIIWRDI
jgi:hypothetical protein